MTARRTSAAAVWLTSCCQCHVERRRSCHTPVTASPSVAASSHSMKLIVTSTLVVLAGDHHPRNCVQHEVRQPGLRRRMKVRLFQEHTSPVTQQPRAELAHRLIAGRLCPSPRLNNRTSSESRRCLRPAQPSQSSKCCNNRRIHEFWGRLDFFFSPMPCGLDFSRADAYLTRSAVRHSLHAAAPFESGKPLELMVYICRRRIARFRDTMGCLVITGFVCGQHIWLAIGYVMPGSVALGANLRRDHAACPTKACASSLQWNR